MSEVVPTSAGTLQRNCAVVAAALSEGRRTDARLVTGENRAFGLSSGRRVVHVPYPHLSPDWTIRTLTCGIALQCAPSKDRLAAYAVENLPPRDVAALSVVEGRVALGWVAANWAGLVPEFERVLGSVDPLDPDLDDSALLDAAADLASARPQLEVHQLFGRLPRDMLAPGNLAAALRKSYGRMPWTSRLRARRRIYSIPVGGDGGVRDPNLPPPSRPEDEDIHVRPDERLGIPYPEWNAWRDRFLADHVAVLERPIDTVGTRPTQVAPAVRRWFEEHTHRVVRSGLEDGSDLDIDRYVDHYIDAAAGQTHEPRVFRDLVPGARDVTTALLLDGSSSLGAHSGRVFELELACADALSQAMTLASERHGIFAFTGNTRHLVDVRCLKDFDQRRFVAPSKLGLVTGGYTRLGAPIRHLTARLLGQPSERRLLILIGDGLISDEGYEGRYAWADVAHAVEEAEQAGVTIYYVGVGSTRVDPLPEVFGSRRSQRIRRIDDLPRVLANVHRELVAA
jgi:nitric oxide reductase NorD protein